MKTMYIEPAERVSHYGRCQKKVDNKVNGSDQGESIKIKDKDTKIPISWSAEAAKPVSNSTENNWQKILFDRADQETLKKELGPEGYNRYLKTVDQYSDGLAKPVKIDKYI